ncbi:MAG: serine/threonine protein kinase [Planctomycetes bacterium]|nr:serine/threonine protein kinase [Planctomycetota bacterium]
MASPSDIAFCKRALELGVLSAAQIDECLKIVDQRHSLGIERSARDIAVELGFVEAARAEEIAGSEEPAAAAEPPPAAAAEGAAPPADASPPPAGADIPPRLSGFEIIEKVGGGSMGTVYRARQLSLDKIVALKILSPELAGDRAFVERFVREARAAGHLNHPNIVHGIDAGEDQGFYYIAMEWIEGETLRGVLERAGALAERKALDIAGAVARGLEAAAKKDIVHRDIKPDNIMICRDGRVKITDLGLAVRRPPGGMEDEPLRAMGTPFYISPEAIRGEAVDARSDLYSLGATLYHMVTGVPPFRGDSGREVLRKHLEDEPRDPRELRSDLSSGAAELILHLLHKDPAKRPEPKDLQAAITRMVSTAPLRPPAPPLRPRRPVDAALASAAPARASRAHRASARARGHGGRHGGRAAESLPRGEEPLWTRRRPQRTFTYLLSGIGVVVGILLIFVAIKKGEAKWQQKERRDKARKEEILRAGKDEVDKVYARIDETAEKTFQNMLSLKIEDKDRLNRLENLLNAGDAVDSTSARRIAEAIDRYRGSVSGASPGPAEAEPRGIAAIREEARRLESRGRLWEANKLLAACLDPGFRPEPTSDERDLIDADCSRIGAAIRDRWAADKRKIETALDEGKVNDAVKIARAAEAYIDPDMYRRECEPLIAKAIEDNPDKVDPELRKLLSPDEKKYRELAQRYADLVEAYQFDRAYGETVGGLAEVTDASVRERLEMDGKGFTFLMDLRKAAAAGLGALEGKPFALQFRGGGDAKEGTISKVEGDRFTFERTVDGLPEMKTYEMKDLSPDDLVRLAGVTWKDEPFRAPICGAILAIFMGQLDRADRYFGQVTGLGMSPPQEWVERLKQLREKAA